MWQRVSKYFTPNQTISKASLQLLIGGQVLFLLVVWFLSPFVFLPTPQAILRALGYLWTDEGLGPNLGISFMMNLEALACATAISLGLAYAAVLPFFRPLVEVLSKFRFLSMVGLTFFFTLMAADGHQLRLYLLTYGIGVFFITSMADVIISVPKENFDLARTLGMGPWRTAFEVIVLGQADKVFDVIRQNAAIGWMMLTMVEGISRDGGGIGTLLIDNNKHFHMDAVFAIQITILILGLCQDYAIGYIKNICCPYANLTLERK
jgi:NitT/TauT family transport system permease protein